METDTAGLELCQYIRNDMENRLIQLIIRTGQPGLASLATAERHALAGRMDDARLHAQRAADQLPRGSAPWQRAQDVLTASRQP